MITNIPDVAVKITHIPTGIEVISTSQYRRYSLHKLKNNCLKQLKILLQNQNNPEIQAQIEAIKQDKNSEYSWETIIDGD